MNLEFNTNGKTFGGNNGLNDLNISTINPDPNNFFTPLISNNGANAQGALVNNNDLNDSSFGEDNFYINRPTRNQYQNHPQLIDMEWYKNYLVGKEVNGNKLQARIRFGIGKNPETNNPEVRIPKSDRDILINQGVISTNNPESLRELKQYLLNMELDNYHELRQTKFNNDIFRGY